MYSKDDFTLFVRCADDWDGRHSSLHNSLAESALSPRPAHNHHIPPKQERVSKTVIQMENQHQRTLFARKPHRILLSAERHPLALNVTGRTGPPYERFHPATTAKHRVPIDAPAVLRLPPLCMVLAVGL